MRADEMRRLHALANGFGAKDERAGWAVAMVVDRRAQDKSFSDAAIQALGELTTVRPDLFEKVKRK